jgi:hypothetical protein
LLLEVGIGIGSLLLGLAISRSVRRRTTAKGLAE